MAVGEAVREGCGRAHLVSADTPAEYRGSHIEQALLSLWVNADMIAIHVEGLVLFSCRIEAVSKSLFNLVQKSFRGPPVAKKQELKARTLAMFPKIVGVAKNLCDCPDNWEDLMVAHECVQTRCKMRVGREATANAQGESLRTLHRE